MTEESLMRGMQPENGARYEEDRTQEQRSGQQPQY